MTIKECEPRIEVVKQRFRNYFQTDFDAEVFLLGKAGTCDKRNALFEICRETYFEYLPGTLGETIGSGKRTAVLMYPYQIRYPAEFDRTLAHEFGHVYFCQQNQTIVSKLKPVKTVEEEGGVAKFGFSIWSEFIAQSIANLVMNEEPHRIRFDRQEMFIQQLYDALPGLDTKQTAVARNRRSIYLDGYKINPYALGHYCATYLTDPTIVCLLEDEPRAARGLEDCTDKECAAIDDILDLLCKQLDKDRFWIVDEEYLESLGVLLNQLWNVCIMHK